ncbi:MAG: DNA primase [Gammaproteobacteria bacterium]
MAGQIPKAFIDELLSRIDIVDVIEQYLPLKKAGKDYQALCPFHHEKSPSFTVSQQKQFYYCFGCGASGSAIGFLMAYGNAEFPEAVAELAARAGMQLPALQESGAERGPSLTPLYDILAAAQRWFARQLRDHAAAAKAKDYLRQRGLTGEMAQAFGIGYAPPGWDNLLRALGIDAESIRHLSDAGLIVPREGGHYDRFRDRIMFPIHDQRGRVVGFGGRVLGAEEPKYLNSPETPVFHKGRELYGLYRARRETAELRRLIVVEGYMDVVALSQHGVTNAVATLGTATTREHLERLFRSVPEVVFCFDGDNAGRRAAWRALEVALPLLRDGRSAGFLFMPAGEDPDSQVRKAGTAMFQDQRAVQPLSEFLFGTLCARVDMQTLDGRARMVEEARPLLNQIPPGALRTLLNHRLMELAQLSEAEAAPLLGAGDPPPRRIGVPAGARTQARAPSLVRIAIARLMHQPALAAGVIEPAVFRKAGQPGCELLAELLEFFQARPDASAGAAIENLRGTPHAGHLSKLMSSEPPGTDEDRAAEFSAALARLRERAEKAARNQVLNRRNASEYSDEEKAAIRAALQARRPPGRGP